MRVVIEPVEHADQRYPTAGDWRFDEDGNLTIRVSRLPDERYEFLIALHELIEAYLCKAAGITQESVDDFDMAWEAGDREGHSTEPGDDPRAPYHAQHEFAAMIEKMLAYKLKVRWKAYEAAIAALE